MEVAISTCLTSRVLLLGQNITKQIKQNTHLMLGEGKIELRNPKAVKELQPEAVVEVSQG